MTDTDPSVLLPEPVKRKNKKKSSNRYRRLRSEEFELLRTIWRWKVLNYPLVKELIYKKVADHNSYTKIRRLLREGYIEECFGTNLEITALKLTKKGFEQIKYDLGELTQNRFSPQSVAHDYWAMAFQMGEFAINPSENVEFITENEIQTQDPGIFFVEIPKSRDHIPDGLTIINDGGKSEMFAIEVELNQKPVLRYVKAAYYFDSSFTNINTVFWLCDEIWLMKKIFRELQKLKLQRLDIHHFVLLEDFQKLGWEAKARSGREINKKIREVYFPKSTQNPTKILPKVPQGKMHELFVSKKKSPWKPRLKETGPDAEVY